MPKTTNILLYACLYFLLAGCVTSVDESLPYAELPEITVATEVNLVASPSHPTAYLPFDPIAVGEKVQVIGVDEDAAWLLVLHKEQLGWMPSIFSRDNVGTLKTAIKAEPLSAKCAKYLDAITEPGKGWVSSVNGSITILGTIYRPHAEASFDAASLAVAVAGSGMATKSDYIHTPLTPASAVVLFAFAVEGLQKGSEIRFDLAEVGEESLSFQAAFFSDECAANMDASRLPIGEIKRVSTEQDDALQNNNAAAKPASAPAPLIISPARNAASFYDEFDSTGLNAVWNWLKEDPSRWSLEERPGTLRITATGGDMALACRNHQNLLLQDALSENFEIQTKVTIRPTQNYQQGGLIVFDDLDNYIRLDLLWSDAFIDDGYKSGEGIELLSEQKGVFTPAWPAWPRAYLKLDNEGVFLKIRKEGVWYDGYYSKDGQQWIRLGSISVPTITNPQVGIFAVGGATNSNNAPNCIHTAPDIPVDFDFFYVNSTEASEPMVQPGSTERLMTHFEKSGYEYAWLADNAEKSVRILDLQIDGNLVTMHYDSNNGSLTGVLNDNVYAGQWASDAGSGAFEFTFAADFATATGWWRDGDNGVKQIQFLR